MYLVRFTLWNGNLLVSKCSDLLWMMYLRLVSPGYGFVTSRFFFKIWVHHPRTFSKGETFSEIYFSYRFRIGINYLRVSRFVFAYLMVPSVDILVFRRCRKIAKNCCLLHVRPSFCSHGTTWLPLDGFSWNFIFEYFSKIYQENSGFVKIGQEYRVLYLKSNIRFWPYIAELVLEWDIFQTKVTEKVETHFIFDFFLSKIMPFMR
jgi:hypothetical protein